ncbi:MAG: ClC family H(+)/Cl(-) exchange transporter [Spirochaetaceae bacterium]|nr:ClC family H(+)/Cl(-) exchange transporter [Spirochaetaceae bacterium]
MKEHTRDGWYGAPVAVILECILAGLGAGGVIGVFRILLGKAGQIRRWVYGALPSGPAYAFVLWIGALVLIGLFLGWGSKKFPMIRGSGIPQLKGALSGKLSLRWTRELPMKVITGILSIGAGLSLGREGPSIQIGSYVGEGILSFFPRKGEERRFVLLAASAAGVSAAFNAPLAGVFFVVEEMGAQLSPLFLSCAMAAAAVADGAAGFLGEPVPVFSFRLVTVLPLSRIHWVILLGILCGLLGALFKRSLYTSLDLYDRLRIPPILRPVIPLLASVPLAFFLSDVTGGGQELIESLAETPRALPALGILLGAKLLFTALCYGSGTSGGIFLPFLSCGALTGVALGTVLALGGITAPSECLNFLVLGMAAFFTAVVGAPLTGIVLILEMAANFNHLGNLIVTCFFSFLTVNLMGSMPVYHVLLERLTGGQHE